jgi:peptide deformylase
LNNEHTYSIRLYGDPVLRQTAVKVTDFSEALRNVADGMIETLLKENGLGLAAPQVGVTNRIVVTDRSTQENGSDLWVIVNPDIVALEGECSFEEGCLSLPKLYEDVVRPEFVRLKYQDMEGNDQVAELEGMMARVVQHEVDHLNGILFIDRLSIVKRQLLAKSLKSLAEKGTID